MSELYRSLLVVLVIASGVFWFAKKPMVTMGMAPSMFALRRNLWLGVTLAAFLANNFWIFILLASVLLIYGRRHDENQLALFFSLLFAVPLFKAEVGGLGIVNFLFDLNYFRLLSFLILFPTYWMLRQEQDVVAFGKTRADKFIAAYLILGLALQFPIDTLTNSLRTAFYLFIDVFLPYYVASRYIKNIQQFRDVLLAFVMASLVIGIIGVFEFAKGWLLYSNITSALGLEWALGQYLNRGESLRALATTGTPIVLGYVMAVALGFYLYVCDQLPNIKLRWLGALALGAGLISPLSRGPWVGVAVGYLVFLAVGPKPAAQMVRAALSVLVASLIVLATPFGDKLIDYLPFVGQVDNDNVIYRERLLTNASTVIARNPFFGSFDYYSAPEMESLRSGGDDGIIDLVNTYLAVALRSGLVGLFLFVGFFISLAVSVFKAAKTNYGIYNELALLGRVLLAVLLGVLFTIYTVSSITHVAIIYWTLAGLCGSYIRLSSKKASHHHQLE